MARSKHEEGSANLATLGSQHYLSRDTLHTSLYMRLHVLSQQPAIDDRLKYPSSSPGVIARARYRATTSRLCVMAANWACLMVPMQTFLVVKVSKNSDRSNLLTRDVYDMRYVFLTFDGRQHGDRSPSNPVMISRNPNYTYISNRRMVFHCQPVRSIVNDESSDRTSKRETHGAPARVSKVV